jgi:hypothetical protein
MPNATRWFAHYAVSALHAFTCGGMPMLLRDAGIAKLH